MRENMGLYRGKRTRDGVWIEGPLLFVEGKPAIYDQTAPDSSTTWWCGEATLWGCCEVDPETVGQFTGFYDSTKWEDLTLEEQQAFLHQSDGWENTPDVWPGKRIFENDILEFDDVGETGYEYKEGFDFTNRAAVLWANGRWELHGFLDNNSGVNEDMTGRSHHEDFIQVFESSKIIGIFPDNIDLLERKEEFDDNPDLDDLFDL